MVFTMVSMMTSPYSTYQKDYIKYKELNPYGMSLEAYHDVRVYNEALKMNKPKPIVEVKVNEKKCSLCKKPKPFSEFSKIKTGGYKSWCKQCTRDRANERNRRIRDGKV